MLAGYEEGINGFEARDLVLWRQLRNRGLQKGTRAFIEKRKPQFQENEQRSARLHPKPQRTSLPAYATPSSAGMDVQAKLETPVVLQPGAAFN